MNKEEQYAHEWQYLQDFFEAATGERPGTAEEIIAYIYDMTEIIMELRGDLQEETDVDSASLS